jgi:regulator of sigma E protease
MITVHELGHYISGKIFKFKINEFAIGFGPALLKKQKKNGEVFSIRALPLGGFCAFGGEDEESENENDFNNKPVWQRIIVLISGALMNYIFALVVIMLMFGIYGGNAIKVTKVEQAPAYVNYSLQENDIIIKAGDKNVYLVTDLIQGVENREQGERVDFVVIRNGETVTQPVVLRTDTHFDNLEDISKLCSALGTKEQKPDGLYSALSTTSVRYGFFQTIGRSFEYSVKLAGTVFAVLGQLLTGRLGISSMGGTVTTLTLTAEAVSIGGFQYLLYMGSFLGVNLAVFNLLPVPALDGSRVVFCAIEGIRKKPVSRKVEGVIHTIGLIALMLFAVFVDLQHCF